MRVLYTSLVLCGLFSIAISISDKAKNIAIFNVVKFQNTECTGGNNNPGTCYTTEECEDREGTADGSCAEGYGVCCIFEINCGGSSSENLTTFMSNDVQAGACQAKICKIDSDVVQLRLDFTTFVISDPSTSVATAFSIQNGNPVTATVLDQTSAGVCDTDSFAVTSPGGAGTPTICGVNTDEHMYVDAADACNMLTFSISENSLVTPMWSIRVTQYARDFTNKAPPGCLQYHFDSDTGVIRSFNWNGGAGRHLSNQNQLICIRREATRFRICYSQEGGAVLNDFLISAGVAGDASAQMGVLGTVALGCGNYGASGSLVDYDFVHIPMASADGTAPLTLATSNFCGGGLVTAQSAAAVSGSGTTAMNVNQITICSRSTPFQVRFVTDFGESALETKQNGFQLGYIQT